MPLPPYPPTPIRSVVDVLHGQAIPDPYRWLENGDCEEVRRWTRAQNAYTEAYLERVAERPALRARLAELLAIGGLSVPTPARGRYFYQRRDGDENQPVLYVREGSGAPDRVLLDPNALDASGTTALDWYFPSEDGSLLAYGLSRDGSEQSVLHVLEVATGRVLDDRIPGTRSAELAWLRDGTGFFYTRSPLPGEVPEDELHYHRAIYFHRLGHHPARDLLVFKPARKEHWPGVALSPDGRWLIVTVARTFDQHDVFLKDLAAGGNFVPLVRDLPFAFEVEIVRDLIYIHTNLDAPNYRLFVAPAADPVRRRWREIVPERQGAVLNGVKVVGEVLALSYLERACSRLRLAGLDGNVTREIELPTLGTVFGWDGEWDGEELFYGFSSFSVPPSVYRVDLRSGRQELWRRVEADLDSDAFEVEQVAYPSRDGTEVTMFLVRPRDLIRDGARPVYLTGYGGFAVSLTPSFSRSLLLWLERGGIVAMPNLRGGGEYGEAWHRAGMLERKQNTFDDFIAAAEWLIEEGYTRPDRLAIAGGSNGGLLVGAAVTQRPELFRAAVLQVPLLDMLRYHKFLIARLWLPEYGDPEHPEQFRWLRAYSPYHRVREGVAYPAVLLATAESDSRVDPMHARKMAARLQAASASGRPVLLRLEPRAGHGAGKPISKVLDELVDTWSFLFQELEVSSEPWTKGPGSTPGRSGNALHQPGQ